MVGCGSGEIIMSSETYLDNPHYVAHVELLKKIHLLMAQGKSETEEADALREATEPHWNALSDAERDRLRWLSADLYSIEGKERFTKVPAEQRTRKYLEPAFEAARVVEDWDMILDLLRTGPDYMSAGIRAQARGVAYQNLGLSDIALLFFKHAAEQEPRNIFNRLLMLTPLRRLGRFDELLVEANRLLKYKNLSTIYQFIVASKMAFAAEALPVQEKSAVLRQIIRIINTALQTDLRMHRRDLLDYSGSDVYFALGACYWRLNDISAAIRAFKECLKLNPADNEVRQLIAQLEDSRSTTVVPQPFRDSADKIDPFLLLAA